MRFPDGVDPASGHADLAGDLQRHAGFGCQHQVLAHRLPQLLVQRQPQVEGGGAAVAADLEHVVFPGVDPAVADVLGPPGQFLHELHEFPGWLDDDGLGCALPVSGAWGQRRDGQLEVLGGLDVG